MVAWRFGALASSTSRANDALPHKLVVWHNGLVSGTYAVTMGNRGRIVVPAEVRERSGMHEGAQLVLFETPSGLVVISRERLKELVRRDLAGYDLVTELLAERRQAAAVSA